MRGQILSFDDASGAGLISGDDGIRYSFVREAVSPPASITAGLRVDFVPVAGEATNIMLLAAAPASSGPSPTPGVPRDDFDFARALFSFEGRLRRSHYWIAWAITFGTGFLLNFIPLLNLLGIVLLWPHLAIGAKRLHDMGHSGWLIAIPYVVMIGGWIYAFASIGVSALLNAEQLGAEDPAAIMATFGPAAGALMLTWLVGIAFWLWMGLADSQRGANRFGPNPKGE